MGVQRLRRGAEPGVGQHQHGGHDAYDQAGTVFLFIFHRGRALAAGLGRGGGGFVGNRGQVGLFTHGVPSFYVVLGNTADLRQCICIVSRCVKEWVTKA